MKRSALVVLPLIAAAGLLAACDATRPPCSGDTISVTSCLPPTPDGSASQLDATAVELLPDSPGRVNGSIAIEAIDIDVLRGWNATTGSNGDVEPRDPAKVGPVGEPGMSYVVVSASTGCRLSTAATLWRKGSDVYAEFTGGTDHEECVRAYQAYAEFAVPSGALDGVTTVQGEQPVDPRGPGHLEVFANLTGLDIAATFPPVFLRDDEGAKLYESLREHGAPDSADTRATLTTPPPVGRTGIAFVLDGCTETSAVLLVTPTTLSAGLTGDRSTACESAVPFLVMFTIADENLPPEARPTTAGHR